MSRAACSVPPGPGRWGISAYVVRVTMPWASNWRSLLVLGWGLMPGREPRLAG